MGILSRIIGGFRNFSLEDPDQPLLPMSVLFESLGLGRSDAGVMINEKQALRITTAFGCINNISSDLSRLPLEIFQTMPGDSSRKATDHSMYNILHRRPNPQMSSQVWRMAMHASVCSNGNAYSWIKRDRAARVISLVPLASSKTSPVRVVGKYMYATTQTDSGQVAYIDPEDILHFMGLSLDGIVGLSPIGLCKNAFGLAMGAEKFGAQFFGNGARSTGIFSHPETLEPESLENLKKSLRERMNGDNALAPLVLEEGMKWQQLTIPPNEAQFLETRKFQKEEIACLYRMPMHLLQDLQRSTNNNIEHQGLDYVRFCLAPRAVNMEQEIDHKLLSGPFFCEHNLNDLERGDFASQTAGFTALRNIGVYHTNDILKGLRKNTIPVDEGGEVRTVQGAFIPLTSLLAEEDEPAAPETADTDADEGAPAASLRQRQIVAAYRPLFRDAVGHAINRADNIEFARKAFCPAVESMAQALLAARFGSVKLSQRDRDFIGKVADEIATGSDGWRKKDAAAIATRITEQVYSALAKEILA